MMLCVCGHEKSKHVGGSQTYCVTPGCLCEKFCEGADGVEFVKPLVGVAPRSFTPQIVREHSRQLRLNHIKSKTADMLDELARRLESEERQ